MFGFVEVSRTEHQLVADWSVAGAAKQHDKAGITDRLIGYTAAVILPEKSGG